MTAAERNNPFDLRKSPIQWEGLVGYARGFCCFGSLTAGVRAGYINLCNAQRLHGRTTPRLLLTPYAPASENDLETYIRNFCDWTGIAEGETLRLEERARLMLTGKAIVRQEGVGPDVSDAAHRAGIDAAYAHVGWDELRPGRAVPAQGIGDSNGIG